MSDGYRRQRVIYGNDGGGLLVTTLTGTTTLIGAKTNHTVNVQRVHVHVTSASAGKTWNVQDEAGHSLTGAIPTDTVPADFEYDFGPQGVPLTAGQDLQFVPSGTGAGGVVTWDAYQKLTTVTGDHA